MSSARPSPKVLYSVFILQAVLLSLLEQLTLGIATTSQLIMHPVKTAGAEHLGPGAPLQKKQHARATQQRPIHRLHNPNNTPSHCAKLASPNSALGPVW